MTKNTNLPSGSPVFVLLDNNEIWETKTRTKPYQLCDGAWVVMLEGRVGGFDLERVFFDGGCDICHSGPGGKCKKEVDHKGAPPSLNHLLYVSNNSKSAISNKNWLEFAKTVIDEDVPEVCGGPFVGHKVKPEPVSEDFLDRLRTVGARPELIKELEKEKKK